VLVDFLVEVADGPGTYPRAPQGLGNIFHPAHRHTRQVHLDQRFLDRGFTAPVALDNGGFKGLTAQLGDFEIYFAGLGMQATLITPSPGIHSVRAAFVALRATQGIGFSVQHRIQCLFDGASNQFA